MNDWREGVFTLERVASPMDPSTLDARETWTTRLEKGFQDAEADKRACVEERIARAFFHAGPFVRENPSVPVERFVTERACVLA